MELWIGALNLGFLYSFMALGTYITYKIFNFPDITVDGSFTTGAAVASVLIVAGVDPFTASAAAFFAGLVSGMLTAIIHTRFKINGLLAGILVMTGLYSINLRVMGKSNIPLLNSPSFITALESMNPSIHPELWLFICLVVLMAVVWFLFSLFMKTDLGITMRATGNNSVMVAANGVNTDAVKIFGIALANGFVGLSGSLVAQYQGFSDIGMGVGSVVTSLAAVIIGEAVIKHRSVFLRIFSVILGSVVFRLMVALALLVGLDPNDLKLITALFVLLTLVASGAFASEKKPLLFNRRKLIAVGVSAAVLLIFVYFVFLRPSGAGSDKVTTIGIVIPNDSDILIKTRDGFLDEMSKLGYKEGENCVIIEQNANGDIPTLATIVDNFINRGVDIYVCISTASTQAAVKKITNKPIVFATIADPFIIGVGKTDTDHPANITGIYGTAPIKEMLGMIHALIPGTLKLGCIWNPTFTNSTFNIKYFEELIKKLPYITFEGATVSGSSEVYQAAASLVEKDISAFALIPDITVFSAFESIVKAAKQKNIPIFTNDVERLPDGALGVYGYEYTVSGRQAARLVDRIIKGESPANIPYEKYKVITAGINFDVAKALNITVPDSLLPLLTVTVKDGKLNKKEIVFDEPNANAKPIRVAVFQYMNNSLLDIATKGVMDYIEESGLVQSHNLKVEQFNAQGDNSTAQVIGKKIVSAPFDYIITVSTLAMQTMLGSNNSIPHIFCSVTDPIKSGAANSLTDHKPWATGLATPQPVEATIQLMRQLFPDAKRIGMLWNPSEVNSEICTKKARDACAKYGFELIEQNVTNTNEITEALESVLNLGIDIFFTSGDITVSVTVPTIAKRLRKARVPFITNTPLDVNDGAFAALGADYHEVGYEAGKLFEEVLKGKNPADIPIRLFVPEKLVFNNDVARELGIVIPADLLERSKKDAKQL